MIENGFRVRNENFLRLFYNRARMIENYHAFFPPLVPQIISERSLASRRISGQPTPTSYSSEENGHTVENKKGEEI